jgi:hypothetical protein
MHHARYKDGMVYLKHVGKVYMKRGECIYTTRALARFLGVPRTTLRDKVKLLMTKHEFIESRKKPAQFTSVVNVINYDTYNPQPGKSRPGPAHQIRPVFRPVSNDDKSYDIIDLNNPGQDEPAQFSAHHSRPLYNNKDITTNKDKTNVEPGAPSGPPGTTKKKYDPTSKEYNLAKHLHDLIKTNNPNFKKPDLHTWALHIDYMIRIDKRNPDEIMDVTTWAQNDDFWQTNILSTKKLRKQYDQLLMKMKKGLYNQIMAAGDKWLETGGDNQNG